MRNKKIAVVKNGYDVMRIIEMNSDNENCELKIVISLITLQYFQNKLSQYLAFTIKML